MSMRIVSCILLVVLVSGCARMTSIYRDEEIPRDEAQILLIDSKQRAIVTAPNKSDIGSYLSICAEPPPDVFSAIATTLAAEASRKDTGEVAAKLGASLSENAATIERTQTINILRESMYRTCERYLSGAIGRTEFIVQAARDQQTMAAILAIEQITGVQKAQATAITTIAKASVGGVSKEAIETLEKARSAHLSAKEASDKKRSEADAMDPAATTCEAAVKSSEENLKAKREACEAATAAEKKTSDALDYYNTVKSGVERMSSVSAESRGEFESAALKAAASSEAVAKQVVRIVEHVGKFDDMGMTCVTLLRQVADGSINLDNDHWTKQLYESCLKLVTAENRRESEKLMLEAREMEYEAVQLGERVAELREASGSNAKKVWDFILVDDKPDADKLKQLIEKAGEFVLPSKLRNLAGSANLADFTTAFEGLPTDVQQSLAKATQSE